MTGSDSFTLSALSAVISRQLSGLRELWIIAETSDVATRSGHCYMELLEKNDRGVTVAKARAAIWASTWVHLRGKFYAATGSDLSTGMKVRVKASVDYHAVYGFKLVVTDIDPTYTIGDAIRHRQEILDRLTREGIIEMNRQLEVPMPAMRIAVVSAGGAAGYGDFINQLFGNNRSLRFNVRLFEAVMQGDRTAPTVIDALNRIAECQEEWDMVVIIRGGGATSDLEAFDNYDLAANVALFPLPVIVGIGHERDVTVLDYVANVRVKTPTAAAEWLIARATACLDRLTALGNTLRLTTGDRIASASQQLTRLEAQLTTAPLTAIEHADGRLRQSGLIMANLSSRVITPRLSYLESLAGRLQTTAPAIAARHLARLDAIAQMLSLLSPEATLRRGYSITRVDGNAVTDASALTAGQKVETTVLNGTFTSTVVK